MVVDVYHLETVAQGIMVSMLGFGLLLGAVVVTYVADRGRRGLVLIATGFASGVVLVLVGSVPLYLVAVLLMVVLGLGTAIQWSLTEVSSKSV